MCVVWQRGLGVTGAGASSPFFFVGGTVSGARVAAVGMSVFVGFELLRAQRPQRDLQHIQIMSMVSIWISVLKCITLFRGRQQYLRIYQVLKCIGISDAHHAHDLDYAAM